MAEPVNCALCGHPAEVVDDRTCFYVRCLPCHEVISSRWVDIDSGTEAENRALADATDWDALREEAIARWNAVHGLAAGTHVVVPVKPTAEMMRAGGRARSRWEDGNRTAGTDAEVYRAMISAANLGSE